MKKKFLTFILCICFIIPCMFMLSACSGKNKVIFIVEGQVYSTIETSGKEEIVLPESPTKAGYKFDGWYYEGLIEGFNKDSLKNKSLDNDINVYAKFLAYKVNFYIDDGLVGYIETAGNESLDLSLFNTSTYTVNWYFDEQLTQSFTGNSLINVTMTQDINVYGKIDYNTYSISFISNGGSEVSTIYKHYGEEIGELPQPTKEHYEFKGWYTDNTLTTKFTNTIMPSVNKTLYAKYTPKTYNIILNLNGSGMTSIYPATYNIESSDILLQDPWYSHREEKSIFLGWELNGKNVGKNYVITKGTTGDIRLKALWETFDIDVYEESVVFNGLTPYGNDNKASITEIEIPKEVTEIAQDAFNGLTCLEEIILEEASVLKVIGERAFVGCTNLNEITIPENITNIGNYAFYNCTALTKINFNAKNCYDLPENNSIFGKCGTLSDGIVVNIGKEVGKIPNALFKNSSANIISVIFEKNSNCSSIGNYAFMGCSNLVQVNFNQNTLCKSIGSRAFSGCTSLETFDFEGVETIKDFAFDNCVGLTQITIPETIEMLNYTAFTGCSGINSIVYNKATKGEISFQSFEGSAKGVTITFADIVTEIPEKLFLNSNITEIIFEGTNCTTIGTQAFAMCENLTSINLPEGVITIKDGAFGSCTNAKTISIPASLKYIAYNAFSNCLGCEILNYNAASCEYLSTDTPMVFYNIGYKTQNGTTIKIGENVESILDSLFIKNANENIVAVEFLGNKIETIGEYAFWGHKITSIIIPESVKEIGNYAFAGSQTLKTIIINSEYISSRLNGLGSASKIEYNADVVYIKTGLSVTNSFKDDFLKQEQSDKAGYDLYVRKIVS